MLSTVEGDEAPEFEITPENVPLPLSLPTERVIDFPPPPSAKSTLPVPVNVPILVVFGVHLDFIGTDNIPPIFF